MPGRGRERREERREERGPDGPGAGGNHYQMRQRMVSIGDDFYIENDALILAVTVAVDMMAHPDR